MDQRAARTLPALLLLLAAAVAHGALPFHIERVEGPPTQGGSLFIHGAGWGAADAATVRVAVDGQVCASVAVVERRGESVVECTGVPAGVGSHTVELTVGSHSVDTHFSYRAPVVKQVTPATGPTDAGLRDKLTVHGENFGAAGTPAAVDVGGFAAEMCVALDHATIECQRRPSGVGQQLRVTVTVGKQSGAAERAFSFDAPSIDVVVQPSTAGGELVVRGDNFGPARTLPADTLQIDGRPCRGEVRVSRAHKEMVCSEIGAHAGGRRHTVRLSSGAHSADVVEGALHFRPPVIERITPTLGGTEGSYTFAIDGDNFGNHESTIEVMVGPGWKTQNCKAETHSRIVCERGPSGIGKYLDVTVIVDGQPATLSRAFSFLDPQVHSCTPAPTRGGDVIIKGRNFGPPGIPVTVGLGGQECRVKYSDFTRIDCIAAAGVGRAMDVDVTFEINGHVIRTPRNDMFSYAVPIIYNVQAISARGGEALIEGENFGADARAIAVTIDNRPCADVQLLDAHRRLSCRAPSGLPGAHHVLSVVVAGTPSADDTMKYSNRAPRFEPHREQYTAVADQKLRVRLPAHDDDGDRLEFDVQGLPIGAEWSIAENNDVQIDFTPRARDVRPHATEAEHAQHHGAGGEPHSAAPQREHVAHVTVSVSDGSTKTHTKFEIVTRACAAGMDMCPDHTCVPAESTCASCRLSELARCPLSEPLQLPVPGVCRAFSWLASFYAAAPLPRVSPAASHVLGYGATVNVHADTTLPLVTAADAVQVGWLQVPGGALPHAHQAHAGVELACVEVRPLNQTEAAAAAPGCRQPLFKSAGFTLSLESTARAAAFNRPVAVYLVPYHDAAVYLQDADWEAAASAGDDHLWSTAAATGAGAVADAAPTVVVLRPARPHRHDTSFDEDDDDDDRVHHHRQHHAHSTDDDDDDDDDHKHHHHSSKHLHHKKNQHKKVWKHAIGAVPAPAPAPAAPRRNAADDRHLFDTYGYCLGQRQDDGSWHCVDEQLEWAYGYFRGLATQAGTYAIIRDNCPGQPNPRQIDSDGDCRGDFCGIDACVGCGSVNGVNSIYVKAGLAAIKQQSYTLGVPDSFDNIACLPNFLSTSLPPLPTQSKA